MTVYDTYWQLPWLSSSQELRSACCTLLCSSISTVHFTKGEREEAKEADKVFKFNIYCISWISQLASKEIFQTIIIWTRGRGIQMLFKGCWQSHECLQYVKRHATSCWFYWQYSVIANFQMHFQDRKSP